MTTTETPVVPPGTTTAVLVQHCVHSLINTYVPGIGLDRSRAVLDEAQHLGWVAAPRPGGTQEAVVVGHDQHGRRVAPPTHVVPNRTAFAWLVDRLALRAGSRGCERCSLMGGGQ